MKLNNLKNSEFTQQQAMKHLGVMREVAKLSTDNDVRYILFQVRKSVLRGYRITSFMPYSDESLWDQAVHNKDKEALTVLLTRYEPLVKGVLRHHIRGVDYEEMYNELWTQIIANLETYKPEVSPFASWIKNLVSHRYVDLLRKQGRHQERYMPIGNPSEELDGEDCGQNLSHLFFHNENAEAEATRNLLRDEVQWAMDSLPEREREVILRYYFHGESLQSVAASWQCSRPNVSKCLMRAKAKLQEALEGWYYPN